jgi:hypothetical protein
MKDGFVTGKGRRVPAPPKPPRQKWHRRLLQSIQLLFAKKAVWGLTVSIGVLLGILTSIDEIIEDWDNAVPTISPPGDSGDALPLDAPFIAQNNSSFEFKNATSDCTFDNLRWDTDQPVAISRLDLSHPQPNRTIRPGKLIDIDCVAISKLNNFSKFHLSGNLISMRGRIILKYSVLGIPRTFKSAHYCWQPTPPSGHQWVVCDSL